MTFLCFIDKGNMNLNWCFLFSENSKKKKLISVTMATKFEMATPNVAAITILNSLLDKMQNSLLLHFEDLDLYYTVKFSSLPKDSLSVVSE